MRLVAVYEAAGAGQGQPGFEPRPAVSKDVARTEKVPENILTSVAQQPAALCIDAGDGVGVGGVQKPGIEVGVGMLKQGVADAIEERPLPNPLLQRRVALELGEVVKLAADTQPIGQPRAIAERPQHHHLVVTQQHRAVGTVARVAQRTDPKRAAVDEVAQEDGMPRVRRIGLERRKEALEVTVDVADDEDREPRRYGSRRTALVWLPIVCSSLRWAGHCHGPKAASASPRRNGRAVV